MVARSSGDEFAAEAGVAVNLQHVDADVRNGEGKELIERALPAFLGLIRKAGDEIDADFGDARFAQASDVGEGDVPAVQAAHRARFPIDKRLYAERDAIDACAQQRGQNFIGERAGGDFDGTLGRGRKLESPRDCGEEAVELIGGQNARRAAAEIDRVEMRIEGCAKFAGKRGGSGNRALQVRHVTVKEVAGKDAGGKIAEGTFGPAERHRKIKRGMNAGGQGKKALSLKCTAESPKVNLRRPGFHLK